MRALLKDVSAYVAECWRTAVQLRERRRQMWALLAALLALPLVWLLGGKIEPTAEGAAWLAVWVTTSALITLFAISPFHIWRERRRSAAGGQFNGESTGSIHIGSVNFFQVQPIQPPTAAPRQLTGDGAYIKFSPRGVVVRESYNVSSYTDAGSNTFTINFANAFDTSNIVCTPIGATPRDFVVLSVSPISITLRFEGDEAPLEISLWLQEIAFPRRIIG